MDPETDELRRTCANAGLDDVQMANALSEHSGHRWKPSQIRHLSKKEEELVAGLTPDASSADKLIESFRQR